MKIGIAAFAIHLYDCLNVARDEFTLLNVAAITEISGTGKKGGFCGGYWAIHDGVCYYTRGGFYDLPEMRTWCEERYSKILKIESTEQLKFVQPLFEYGTRVWVDLHRRTQEESPGWYWGDGTPFVPKVLTWRKGSQNLPRYTEFALTTQGTLIPHGNYDVGSGYICEIKPTNGKCPKDYKLNGDTCYFLSDLSEPNDDLMMYAFYQASFACSDKTNGSQLLEIRSEKKMRAVKRLIAARSQSVLVWFIGLTTAEDELIWPSDRTNADWVKNASYIQWGNENDNLGGEENCAVLHLHQGYLQDVDCSLNRASGICAKPDIIPMFSAFTGKFGCGKRGWIRGGMHCYLMIRKSQDWDTARANCQEVGGDLVKFVSPIERMWLRNLMSFYHSVWTGLCYKNGAWRWTDGQIVDSHTIEWDAEPKDARSNEATCAVVNVKGEFLAKRCDRSYRFICELREADESKCPSNWKYFNGSCYLMVANNQTTWRDARYRCRASAERSHLFFPNYVQEIDFVVKTFLQKVVRSKEEGKTPLYAWTILTDDKTGVWGYLNSTHRPVDTRHINWRKSPTKEATKKNGLYCAKLTNGLLSDHPRNMTFMSVCQRLLDDGSKPPVEPGGGTSLLVSRWWILAACGLMVTRWRH